MTNVFMILIKEISVADFNSIYRIPRLIDALDECIEIKKYSPTEMIRDTFGLLIMRFKWIGENNIAAPFSGKDSLTAELFTPALGERLKTVS